MSSIPVLKSKLVMPELSGSFLLTDRLVRLHQKMDSCRAVNVCAPAGYGKTTLAVSYLTHHAVKPFRVCWYRPDPDDRNLEVFINHLVEAVFPREASEYAEARKALEDNTDLQLQPYHAVSMICHEMWACQSQADTTQTYIVLDDFQNVAQVQDICDMTRYMLDNLPPSCSIFLLNRANLQIFTEKQKLDQKIIEISMEDLAFSNTEIEAFMVSIKQTATDKALAEIIRKNTEGWIAGIIILCQAVKTKGTETTSLNLDMLGHEDALFRYLSLEVLKSVDIKTQDSLARLALLEDFSEAEASEILETGDIASLIKHCIGFGMFIQRIPGNPIVYRFHSLFREFLLTIMKNRYSQDEISGLHLKATDYYIKQAKYGRASEHLTKCGRSPLAMEMVTRIGFSKLMVGESGQLKVWLDLIPEEMIDKNPILLLYKAQLMPNSRQLEIVGTLREVMRSALFTENLELYFGAASILVYILICNNRMDALVEMTADMPKQSEPVPEEIRSTLAVLDMVRSIGEGRFLQAQTQSESVLYTLLREDNQWLYLVLSCIIYYCLGKLDLAERCIKNSFDLENFKNIEPARGFCYLFLGMTLCLKNEKARLSPLIFEIFAIGEKYNYEYLSANAMRLAAFERYLSYDVDASVEKLDYAVFYFHRMSNHVMASACRLLRCLWSIRHNGLQPDLDEARREFTAISKAQPGIMVTEISQSILGAIASLAENYDLAENCFLSSIKVAKEKKEHQVLCGSLFHLARLYFTQGSTEQGHQHLKQAMALSAANRYFMFWDIHIPTLVEMTLRSIRYGYCADYARELLSKFHSEETVNYLIEKVKNMDESRIASFVGDFTSAYPADSFKQLYFVKASLFGKPEIAINGQTISDNEWKTKKVKNFLEYLLLNSGNTISKELLAEIFWPGSDNKSAIASQRTALYYLRKILSKYNAEATGNNAFIYETLEGLQIRKTDMLELDIHEFLLLHDELCQFTGQTDDHGQKQTNILERMLKIYKGELMVGSDYTDLVLHERERFKSIFMDACLRLAAIHIKRGELQQAGETLRRALATEPYNENICLELLGLYMSQGMRSRAVKLYYSFKKHLEQDLDVKIDRRLTDAIQAKK